MVYHSNPFFDINFIFASMRHLLFVFILLRGSLSLFAQELETKNSAQLFVEQPAVSTNINFSNTLQLDLKNRVSDYVYAGGGVAVGDINNDGLQDVYFVGNTVKDKLYLNKGDFIFEDISNKGLSEDEKGWHTGVNMVDINADGYLDIFVSRMSVDFKGMTNLLYINNHDNTFSERSKEFGFMDTSMTIQSLFFDVDLDGDLDCYILNTLRRDVFDGHIAPGNYTGNQSDLFYENENGFFIEKSEKKGLRNNSFGLGIAASDLNNDGYPDCYISNDFNDGDNLLMNYDGTFTDQIKDQIRHISYYSMGVDIADINNDGYQDIMVLDMGYEEHFNAKVNMSTMSTKKFWKNVNNGNHYQYMQNTLQLNNGNGTFSEIAQLAGISKTDWSWSNLFADFDNDGFSDLLVTNGIDKEIMNQDIDWKEAQNSLLNGSSPSLEILNDQSDSRSMNRLYRNNGDLTFENVSSKWGFKKKINSNGAAYADLDNDGDLDLLINNLDTICSVYENRQNHPYSFLSLELKGKEKNSFSIGAKVSIYSKSGIQVKELFPVRGFQSSVDYRLHFGLGLDEIVDSIVVNWPFYKKTIRRNVSVNQHLLIEYNSSAEHSLASPRAVSPMFINSKVVQEVGYSHNENLFDDFDRELLLPHKYSNLGPTISVGDINGNDLDDFFIGSPKNQVSQLFIQNEDGSFQTIAVECVAADSLSEDVGSLFFDADGDSDLDLLVASGGNDFELNDSLLQDRLYINNGKGSFAKSTGLPIMLSSTKIIKAFDFDSDGDEDLFIGGRITPGRYPESPRSYLLENRNGVFIDVTKEICPELEHVGMVTGVVYANIDRNKQKELVILGEWMPLMIFYYHKGKFVPRKPDVSTEGMWFSLESADIDNDGDIDLIAGNLGINNKFKTSDSHPLQVYGNDFDKSGTFDIVLSAFQDSVNFPIRGKECSSQQMPFINEKYSSYHDFASATTEDIFGEALSKGVRKTIRTLESSIFLNNGKGVFSRIALPNEAQFSPIQGMVIQDINDDGIQDVLCVGNLYETEVETARYDAGRGECLLGTGDGHFVTMSLNESGFYFQDNVKSLKSINIIELGATFLIGINNGVLKGVTMK